MKTTFYVTTPIYYVNAEPHIGHVYTTVAADVLARWHRFLGEPVFFLTGTDEHGSKIAATAEKAGVDPREIADRLSGEFRRLWEILDISCNRFIRTTEPDHEATVRAVFSALHRKGDIYRGKYEGFYCVSCENYLGAADGTTCPDCGRTAGRLAEESYFFRLSRYRQPLLDHFARHPEFIQPERIRSEVLNMLAEPLPDLALTRRCRWGVTLPPEIPGDDLTIYVWFDALLNYLSGIDWRPGALPSQQGDAAGFWPPTVQLVGKDIIRFHHIIWPAILSALELPLPLKIFAHGWWLSGGEKMSKSKGNVVEPLDFCRRYGADPLRYFLLAEVPFGIDGDFTFDAFRKRFNSDLANDLGNLVRRFAHLIGTLCDGRVPRTDREPPALAGQALEIFPELAARMDALDFYGFLEKVRGLVAAGNHYLDEQAPWSNPSRAPAALYALTELTRILCLYLEPVMPASTAVIRRNLGLAGLPDGRNGLDWGLTRPETPVIVGEPLFPRLK